MEGGAWVQGTSRGGADFRAVRGPDFCLDFVIKIPLFL